MSVLSSKLMTFDREEDFVASDLQKAAGRINRSHAKRFLDIVLSGFGLVILSPLFLLIAVVIKIASPGGAVLFVCQRFGRESRIFPMYKFRTMILGAEKQREDLAHLNEMSGAAFKLKKDPRVYPLGRFLRKFSLDELPQLWNVFRGDMSLVGPRPFLLVDKKDFKPWHYHRHLIRPGVTSLWQILGRNKISDFDEWAKLDLEYIRTWSFWKDIQIILATIPVLIRGTGH